MTALLVFLALLLVFLNAFFVIAEYSLVRSSKGRLETDLDEGRRGAALALRELDEIGDYISATQVGVTMTSLGVGALGEPAVAHALEPGLGGPLAHGAAVAIAAIIAYILIT